MINPQLLDFIKGQLQKGVTKESILKDLQSGGWTSQDVEEGFNVIKINNLASIPVPVPIPVVTPAPAPIINPVSAPAVSTPLGIENTISNIYKAPVSNLTINPIVNTSGILVKQKSHSVGKLFLIILVLFLLAGGASAYYFRNDLSKLPILSPIIKKIFPDKNVMVSQPMQPVQNQAVPVVDNTTVKDCGTLDDSTIGKLVYTTKEISYTDIKKTAVNKEPVTSTRSIPDIDKNEALTCMGKALLNNCQKAIMNEKSINGTIHTREILGGDGKICNLKITYQKVNNADVDEKKYEDSYLQCEYPVADPMVELKDGCSLPFIPLSVDECNFFGIKNSVANIYENSIEKMILEATFSAKEISCSGSMISKLKQAPTSTK